jgi:dihydrolipoyl dehydrogenase
VANGKFDLIVIGSGPGGYVAAIRAAQLGLKTAIIEKDSTFGGTCLNIGCIPSKAMLDSSELYQKIGFEAAVHGIGVGSVKLDLAKMLERKAAIVRQFTTGVAGLLKGNHVTTYHGTGRLAGNGAVDVAMSDGKPGKAERVEGRNIIVATGSASVELPNLKFDGKKIVSSTEALSFTQVPEKLIVVGAGAIGLELGSVWSRLGSKVEVVELMPQVLPGWDAKLARTLERLLQKGGMQIHLSTKISGAATSKKGVALSAQDKNGKAVTFEGNVVLVAVGRRPYSEGLGLDAAGVRLDSKGRIEVDGRFRTNVEGVHAIGDVIRGPMLAHKAEDEGIAVAEMIAGKAGHVNYETIPGVVYTWPEVASVGKSEEQLKEAGVSYTAGEFLFRANGRAQAAEAGDGSVKILADAKSDRILGAHIIGPWASDLISEVVTAMEFGGSAEDIARTVHAHPTLSEVVREAALAVDRRSIHAPPLH